MIQVDLQQYSPLLNIKLTRNYCHGQRLLLPETAGLYAFWWLGCKNELMQSNRHIILKGPGGKDIDVEWEDWWPEELDYPCL